MKKLFLFAGISLLVSISFVFAETFQEEESEGREIWNMLLNKTTSCENLSDEQFHLLGEYLMGVMAGDSHAYMNDMMERMFGKQGEEQMHIVMGKRMSGCDTNATFGAGGMGDNMMWGMMSMMTGLGASAIGSCGLNPVQLSAGNVNTALILLAIAAVILLALWLQKTKKPKKKKRKK